MNIVGIFGPKIVVLLAIWFPGYDLKCKLLLTAICGCKLIWDFDRGRPCESGLSYRLTSFLGYDFQEIVISMICLCISGAFTFAAMRESAWIPAVLGMISTAFSLFEVLGAVKVALPERKTKPAAPKVHPPQCNSTQPVVPPKPPVSPIPPNRVVPMGEKRPAVPQASAIVPISKLKESFKQESSRYYRKRFSILGDSISTLDGFVPAGYNVFYIGDACVKASVSRVEDTWWGPVTDNIDTVADFQLRNAGSVKKSVWNLVVFHNLHGLSLRIHKGCILEKVKKQQERFLTARSCCVLV